MLEVITLVARATQGNATAVGHLMAQHRHFVYTMCLSHVGHATEAEDLTQEVFVRVSHDLAQLREPAKFLSWARQVSKNVCRMWTRLQREALMPLDAIAEPDNEAAATQLQRSELDAIVRAMLSQISPISREVLVLHYLAGCSSRDDRSVCKQGRVRPLMAARFHLQTRVTRRM